MRRLRWLGLILLSLVLTAPLGPSHAAERVFHLGVLGTSPRLLEWTRIPQMNWAGRTEDRGNAGETAASFFHPSGPSGLGHLIPRKSLI